MELGKLNKFQKNTPNGLKIIKNNFEGNTNNIIIINASGLKRRCQVWWP